MIVNILYALRTNKEIKVDINGICAEMDRLTKQTSII